MVRFAINHWRGMLSIRSSLIGILIGLGLAIHVLFLLLPETLSITLILVIITIAVLILIWQITGALRFCERNLTGGADVLLYWSCYGISFAITVLLVVDAITLISTTAEIKEPPPAHIPILEVQGQTILIDGLIDFHTNTALLSLLNDPDTKYSTVRLNSDGGRIFAARAIANTIISQGMNTEITGRCASACALIFIAGHHRHLIEGGQLGFHQYQHKSYVKYLNAADEQEKDSAYFRSRGVTDAFIETMFQAKYQDIWFPSRAELLAAGILTD